VPGATWPAAYGRSAIADPWVLAVIATLLIREVLSMRFSYRMVPEVYQLFWAAMAPGEFITDVPRSSRSRVNLCNRHRLLGLAFVVWRCCISPQPMVITASEDLTVSVVRAFGSTGGDVNVDLGHCGDGGRVDLRRHPRRSMSRRPAKSRQPVLLPAAYQLALGGNRIRPLEAQYGSAAAATASQASWRRSGRWPSRALTGALMANCQSAS
jgi:hypothetical protein